jgi:hypothetical protein
VISFDYYGENFQAPSFDSKHIAKLDELSGITKEDGVEIIVNKSLNAVSKIMYYKLSRSGIVVPIKIMDIFR